MIGLAISHDDSTILATMKRLLSKSERWKVRESRLQQKIEKWQGVPTAVATYQNKLKKQKEKLEKEGESDDVNWDPKNSRGSGKKVLRTRLFISKYPIIIFNPDYTADYYELNLWDIKQKKKVKTFRGPHADSDPPFVCWPHFSPNDKFLATGSEAGPVKYLCLFIIFPF